uniref:ATP synthase complex subunit 8 n=1 Tax=Dorytomus tortrix TaxID=1342005 RepID=A0A343C4Q0_9CUCU|nr:ATP synthase F0 subunit 8 [Dorytomus tortrix]
MPQMAPLSWLSLYIFFTILFIMFVILNYFMFLYPPKTFSTKKTTKKINWKW